MKHKKSTFWKITSFAFICLIVAMGVFINSKGGQGMQWARTLQSSDVEKIELVCLVNSENQQYYTYRIDEHPSIVELINNSHGQRLWREPPKAHIEGQLTYLYITTKDGTRHSFVNCKNNYLAIDGEIYDAKLEWLAEWYILPGARSVPKDFWDEAGVLPSGYIYPLTEAKKR